MDDFAFLKPEERVFRTLRNLQKIALEDDLNARREAIILALDRALSWEGQLFSCASDETSGLSV